MSYKKYFRHKGLHIYRTPYYGLEIEYTSQRGRCGIVLCGLKSFWWYAVWHKELNEDGYSIKNESGYILPFVRD